MFVSTMSIEDRKRIMNEARILEEKGDSEGAASLRKNIPIDPKLANELKKIVGFKMLQNLGYNFSDVVKVYGENWLS